MKPTYQLARTAQAATSTTSAQTAQILAPLMAAAAQTMRLGDRKPASPMAPAATIKRPTGPMHRIIHGECLEMMAKIPDRSIDFICADFPYNISGKPGLTMR